MTAQGQAIDPKELVYWGEDGEWLALPGHVDLAAFTVAADARSRADDPGLADDELPSGGEPAYHTYWRPMTREWFDKNSGWSRSDKDEQAKAERYAFWVAEGAVEPCKADDPGAEPWTMIGTGA